jgi:ATP-binding cassette subfamily B protein
VSTDGSRYRDIKRVARLLRSEADREILSRGVATVLICIASGTLGALSPLALKSVVDTLSLSQRTGTAVPWPSALPVGMGYLLLLLFGRVLSDLRPLLSGTINQRLNSRLTQRFFDHVLRLPLGYLLKRRSGELLHRLDLASAGAQMIVAHLAGSVLPVAVEIFTMIGVLIHLGQPALVGVFGAAALAYLAIFSTGARRMGTAARDVSKASLAAHAELGDGLANVETLRYFAAEVQASHRLGGASAALEGRWLRLNRLNFAIALAASGVFALSMAAGLWIGADAVGKNGMTIGGFVLITVYMLQMVRPLESLGTVAQDLARALGYLRPLLELLAEPLSPDSTRAPRATPPAAAGCRVAPTVRLEGLHFGYDPDRPVLKGVDLEVPAGSTTAIVGRSGSGKSTLARLLLGLYTPQRGRILLDGHAIDTIDATELRGALVGLVPQETTLLHTTIAANIAVGAPTASREDIRRAACAAQLDAFVAALPDGLDTPVGERGMQLSGGERQRVGIARALLRRPGLYVLDEPTSMLDTKTELEIQTALRSLSTGATTIVIAHRLSTIVAADEIVVLDAGRIHERGNHRTLLARNGLYAQMWRQQMADAA